MNMTNQPAEVDNLIQEITLMRGLSHPHIVAYLGAWVDAAQGLFTLCFLMYSAFVQIVFLMCVSSPSERLLTYFTI